MREDSFGFLPHSVVYSGSLEKNLDNVWHEVPWSPTIHGHACFASYGTQYVVATSFFPKLIRTCEVERLIVSCGSRLLLHQESPQCALFAIFSIG
jgi:hypothetical protein